ncbi:PIG-L deacetylase family protein [Spirosoma koreense]
MNSGDTQATTLEEEARWLDDVRTIGSALVVAPHPDDESLGCGGTVIRLRQLGYDVHVVFVSDGTLSHPNSPSYPAERLRVLRETEALAALALLDVDAGGCTFLRYRDRSVPAQHTTGFAEAAGIMAALIDQVKPTTIFVPWRRDPHPDHRASWQIVREALRQASHPSRVLEYLIWLWELGRPSDMPEPGEVSVWKVSIADTIVQRDRAIAAHRSQVTRMIDDDPTAFFLSPDLLTHFDRPYEVFLEGSLFTEP